MKLKINDRDANTPYSKYLIRDANLLYSKYLNDERVEYDYTSPLHFGKVIGRSATTNNTSSITSQLPYAETPNIELITL